MSKSKNKSSMVLIKIIVRLLAITFATFPGLFIFTVSIGVISGVSFGVNTYTTQRLFDTVTRAAGGNGTMASVIFATLVMGIVLLASQALNGINAFLSLHFPSKMNGQLAFRINKKTARIDPICFENPEFMEYIDKALQGAFSSSDLLYTVISILTFSLPYFAFMGFYLFSLKPILAISIVLIFIPVAISQLIRSTVFSKVEDEAAPLRREVDYYEKCMCDKEYYKETRILGGFIFFKELYKDSLKLLNITYWRGERKTGLLELLMKIITLIGYLAILILMVQALVQKEISVGAFAAVFASIGAMFSTMERIICYRIGFITKKIGAVSNFVRFLDLPERTGDAGVLNPQAGITLQNVSFAYPGCEKQAVKNVSFKIRHGDTIAIVGENGAGKSTLVRLMMGIYVPGEGSVTVGGLDTATTLPQLIYSGISAVFQKYQRYQLTLTENISISEIERECCEEEIGDALSKADLQATQDCFPQGLLTMLCRNFDGVDLSGGQWQRVAIARGLYRNHSIVVLDEPTSAIDPIEENRLYENFAKVAKDKTAIIVTHRLGSAKIADRIMVMSDGEVIETGTHETLIEQNGEYAKMYAAQAKWYV